MLENTAYLSSWLLLLITFGAMVGSWFYERRVWCRYLCPIGGMNGLYASRLGMATVEIVPCFRNTCLVQGFQASDLYNFHCPCARLSPHLPVPLVFEISVGQLRRQCGKSRKNYPQQWKVGEVDFNNSVPVSGASARGRTLTVVLVFLRSIMWTG